MLGITDSTITLIKSHISQNLFYVTHTTIVGNKIKPPNLK